MPYEDKPKRTPKKGLPPKKTDALRCTAQSRYTKLMADREQYLTRARDNASLTIPALMPREGFNRTSPLPTPYQSVGARGVTGLASKLVLALFPPATPFFRLYVPEELLTKMVDNSGAPMDEESASKLMVALDAALSKAERKVMWEFETLALRTKVNESVEHLIVAGNVLLFFRPKRSPQVYHLDQYVCRRSPSGEVLEVVVVEKVSWGALPGAIRDHLPNDKEAQDKVYDLYTHIHRESMDDDFEHHQEVADFIVPGSEGVYRKNKPMPWLPLRWRTIDGESYGRAFVEELLGDLSSLESLSRSIVIGSAIASKILFLVKPNSTTRIKTLTDAPSGAVREGNPDDVGVVQMNKSADLQMAANLAMEIEKRLNAAFLQAQSVKRNAERVTATEIQLLAQDLEDTLGGVYTLLSLEMQRPIVTVLMESMRSQGKLSLPGDKLEIHILTGLEALGRTADLRKLDQLLLGVAETFGPQVVAQYVNVGVYIQKRAAALATDVAGLIRSEQEVQAMQQQAAQAEQRAAAMPSMIKGMTDMQKNVGDAEADGVAPPGSTANLMAIGQQAANSVAQP